MTVLFGLSGVILGFVIGLEASRLMWQREIDALQTQLRKATEELAQQRQPRLRILPREPEDAA